MLFNSIHFLVFFPTVLLLYFIVPHKYRWIILLGASYYFYMSWKAEYVFLLLTSTLSIYLGAIAITKTDKKIQKRTIILICLLINIGLLFIFRYLNFASNAIGDLLQIISIEFNPIELNLLLPIGISFYTFQAVGYLLDVYWGKIKPEKHFGIFAVFISFFPQLVAGPIERAKNLIPQFFEKHKFDYNRAIEGAKLMLWGFFKKLVIADSLAIIVDHVYSDVNSFTAFPLMLATLFFAIQIYCDFSGYTDIAIGAAKIMGFQLTENFKRPYFSRSFQAFWRRWHITLSSWFRDYIYIPLGGSKTSKPFWYGNIMIVFLLGGLWHGANWTFVIWGGLYGLYLVAFLQTRNIREKFVRVTRLNRLQNFHHVLQVSITFIMLVFAMVFFRAQSISDAIHVINKFFNSEYFLSSKLFFVIKPMTFQMVLIGILISALIIQFAYVFTRDKQWKYNIFQKITVIRWVIYSTIVLAIFFIFNYLLSSIYSRNIFPSFSKISLYGLQFLFIIATLLIILLIEFDILINKSKNLQKIIQEKELWYKWKLLILVMITLLLWGLTLSYEYLGITQTRINVIFISLLIGEVIYLLETNIKSKTLLSYRPIWIRWPIYYSIIIILLLFGIFEKTPFYYIQF